MFSTVGCDLEREGENAPGFRMSVYLLGPATEEHRKVVADSVDLLGFELLDLPVDASASDHTVTLAVFDHPTADVDAGVCPGLLGATPAADVCHRRAWCYADPRICSHEIGHMLGLWDNPGGADFMNPTDRDATTVTDEQLESMSVRLGQIRDRCGR